MQIVWLDIVRINPLNRTPFLKLRVLPLEIPIDQFRLFSLEVVLYQLVKVCHNCRTLGFLLKIKNHNSHPYLINNHKLIRHGLRPFPAALPLVQSEMIRLDMVVQQNLGFLGFTSILIRRFQFSIA